MKCFLSDIVAYIYIYLICMQDAYAILLMLSLIIWSKHWPVSIYVCVYLEDLTYVNCDDFAINHFQVLVILPETPLFVFS